MTLMGSYDAERVNRRAHPSHHAENIVRET